MEINNEYIIYKLIKTNFGDPISSLLLTPDHIIIGTMLGQISYLSLQSKKISILSEFNTENITNISYNSDDEIINISIGDEKILRYKKDKRNPERLYLFQKESNYANEIEHNNFCQNCYTSLSSELLFRIQLSPPEEKCLNIIEIENEYDIINIINNEIINIARLPMTNYIVPFGFNGEYFAWVEFIGPGERNICIANVISNINNDNNKNNLVETYKKNIDNKEFGVKLGHISHLKILNESKIFIVHSLNVCEIRELNQDFTLIDSFKHLGDVVYAVDIYYPNEYIKMKNCDKMSSDILLYGNNIMKLTIKDKNNQKTINENNLGKLNNKERISKNEENPQLEKSKTVIITKKRKKLIEKDKDSINNNYKQKISISISNNSQNSKSIKNSNNIKKINTESFSKNKDNEKEKSTSTDISYSIITLDIDGNVNLYQNGEEVILFNLYDIKDISDKYKKDEFFSFGYEYYIKSNLEFFCISTDQGCFVVKKN